MSSTRTNLSFQSPRSPLGRKPTIAKRLSTRKGTQEVVLNEKDFYTDVFTRSLDLTNWGQERVSKVDRKNLRAYLESAAEKVRCAQIIIRSVSGAVSVLRVAADSNGAAGAASSDAARMAESVRDAIRANPSLEKSVLVGIHRFDDSQAFLLQAMDHVKYVESVMGNESVRELETFPLNKLQGKIYLLCNLYESFKDHGPIAALFAGFHSAQRGGLIETVA